MIKTNSNQRNEAAQDWETHRPLVSVIIPVYNVAPYLEEAIDSVLQQTYGELDIIIVNDGSTDGSGTVCDGYGSDPRVKVIHQENRGLSCARNVGLDRAEGDYIAFLDSDDAFHPGFIGTMMDVMDARKADLAVCGYTVYRTVGTMSLPARKNRRQITEPRLQQGMHGREDALRALVDGKLNTSVWNKLYKRELWDNIRFPEGHNYEDTDTMYRVLDFCSSVYMEEEPLYLHRKHSGSITHSASWKNIKDMKLAWSHRDEYIQKNTPGIFREDQIDKCRRAWLNTLIVYFIKNSSDSQIKEKLKEEILAAEKAVGIKTCGIRTRMAYRMVCFCPWLLRLAYSLYLPARLQVLRVTGK